MRSLIEPTPWDAAALGLDTYELKEATPRAIAQMREAPGHYTVRVAPSADRRLLLESGFYYCDTLIEPWCRKDRLLARRHADATLAREVALEKVLAICHGAFRHGRFHRDLHVAREAADRRYDRWLAELHAAGRVRGLLYRDTLAGFIAVQDARLVLHAVAAPFRGRGLAGYWWSALCEELFAAGHSEVTSSISAANLAALNLYASLGFRFRNPLDIYHCVIA
ncbi:MAG TPA: GNAT family N-acetyltransferase [Burkholderiales bacterium]|nr:GNAT family N-acetyltransferase [Burkholderiales bacterium]